ncbi:MAG: zinc ABC transporter substrate-binding protein [Sphaerobacter sp.]|nr:zinc ABC transporter substrate-binding protein [Sphaerobacter sp.]
MEWMRWIDRRGRWPVVVALIAALLLVACGPGRTGTRSPAAGEDDALRVVVSLPVFISMVEAVGGERVDVTALVPPGADPHTYQPTPADAKTVADADLVFVNGAGLEEWLRGLIESAGGKQVPVYELAQGLTTIQEDDPDHEHPEGNPHLWLDPTNAIAYVRQIEQRLSEHDPDGAGVYRANADGYIAEIEAFDQWAREQIATIPPERRTLVTYHDAFPYFAAHYGLKLVGVVVPSPGREPAPRDLARLVDEIRAQQVPVLFVEPQFNPKLADRLAQEAGITTQVLYSETPPESGGYLEMMRTNVEHVVEGLG